MAWKTSRSPRPCPDQSPGGSKHVRTTQPLPELEEEVEGSTSTVPGFRGSHAPVAEVQAHRSRCCCLQQEARVWRIWCSPAPPALQSNFSNLGAGSLCFDASTAHSGDWLILLASFASPEPAGSRYSVLYRGLLVSAGPSLACVLASLRTWWWDGIWKAKHADRTAAIS